MDESNPYASPAHSAGVGLDRVVLSRDVGLGGIFSTALQIYVRHFPVILAVVLIVWMPLELFTSYLNYFVFEADDLQRSFQLSMLLDALVGIVATGAVISIAAAAVAGEEVRLSTVFLRAVAAWPRLVITRLFSGLLIGLGLIACVVPGIYLAVRLVLAEIVAVVERAHGPTAVQRSFELTKPRLGMIFLLLLLSVGGIMIASFLVFVPVQFVPAMDNFVVDAALTLTIDVMASFVLVCFYVAYAALALPQETRELPQETP